MPSAKQKAGEGAPDPLPACDDRVLILFLEEIERQADFALLAANALGHAVQNRLGATQVSFFIQSFLGCTAMVAKLIWPRYARGKRRLADRQERLERLLQVDEAFFEPGRALRNDFEHFDERLEEWAVTVESGNFVDGNINVHLALGEGLRDGRLRNLRTTDPPAILFRDKECLLEPLIAALKDAKNRAVVARAALEAGRTRGFHSDSAR